MTELNVASRYAVLGPLRRASPGMSGMAPWPRWQRCAERSCTVRVRARRSSSIASSSRSRRLCDGVELGVRGVLFREVSMLPWVTRISPRLEPRRHRITRSVKQCSRGASLSAGPTASTSRVRGHARAHRSAGETGGRALRRWPPCSGPRAPGRAAPPRRHSAGARTTRMARPQAERYTLPPAGSISPPPPRFPAAQRGKRPPHVDEQERRRGGLDLPPSSRDRGEGRWRLGRASAGAGVERRG